MERTAGDTQPTKPKAPAGLIELKGKAMPKSRKLETEEERNERLEKNAKRLHDAGAAEDIALDAMVRKSIKLHGA